MVSPVLTERRHSGGFLVSEANGERSRDQVTILQQGALPAPATPSLSAGTSGSMPSQTVYVKVTYLDASGEGPASAEASQAVSGSTGDCVVTSPSAQTNPLATGYNIYAGIASGAETLQNTTPVAIGTNTTLTTVITSATLPPSAPLPVILPAGLVLGEVAVGSSATYTAGGSNTGNFTCGTVTVGAGVVEGTYSGEFIAATTFNVYLPNGELLGEGHTGSAFSVSGLGFTITAGGTAAVVGDNFTIAIAASANVGLYAPLSLLASDGTQNAAAILFNETDASQGNVKATVIDRTCEVNASELIWPASATAAQITAAQTQLAALGVVSR